MLSIFRDRDIIDSETIILNIIKVILKKKKRKYLLEKIILNIKEFRKMKS